MPPTDDMAGRQRRVDVRIKINLRYPDRDTFVSRFAHNLSRTGIFIRASDPAPVGSRIRFEYRLVDDSRILRGAGIVRWARRPEEADPKHPPGMGLEFIDLDEESDRLVQEIVARFGEGERAPKRRRKVPTPVPAPTEATPTLSLEAASLDPEEESALDALLGPPMEAPSPPPLSGEPSSTSAPLETAPGVSHTAADLEGAAIEVEAALDLEQPADATEEAFEEAFEVDMDVSAELDEEATPAVESTEIDIDVSAERDEEATPAVESTEIDIDVPAERDEETTPAVGPPKGVLPIQAEEAAAEDEPAEQPNGARGDRLLSEPVQPSPLSPSDEALLAEFDDADDEPGAAPPVGHADAVPIHDHGLAELEDEPATAGSDWILDLSGANLLAAPMADPAAAVVSELELVATDGRLTPGKGGTALPDLIAWAGRPWPSAYALSAARRHGVRLADTEEQVVITLGGTTAPIWDAVDALVDQATSPFAANPPDTVHVIIPASTSDAVRGLLHDRIAALGVGTVTMVPDALALLRGVDASLEPGHWALVIHVGLGETRVALIRGPDRVVTTHAAPDLGLRETDEILVERCAAALLRQYGIDVERDAPSRADLLRQVMAARRSGDATWRLSVGEGTLEVDAATLGTWTAVWRERVAITCESLLSTHGGELAAPSVMVVATEEPAWPGLAETLTELLGAEAQVAAIGHDGRRQGIV